MSRGQRSRLLHEVNDRIYDLLESADPDFSGEFHCECGNDCGRRVTLSPAAFLASRQTGQHVRADECLSPSFGRRDRGERPVGGLTALG